MVPVAKDLFQLDRHLVIGLQPALRRPDDPLVSAIRLLNMVGEVLVLVGDLRIEQRGIEFSSAPGLRVQGFEQSSKVLDVLLRHRPRSISPSPSASSAVAAPALNRSEHNWRVVPLWFSAEGAGPCVGADPPPTPGAYVLGGPRADQDANEINSNPPSNASSSTIAGAVSRAGCRHGSGRLCKPTRSPWTPWEIRGRQLLNPFPRGIGGGVTLTLHPDARAQGALGAQ
jgi:hypothetical protein